MSNKAVDVRVDDPVVILHSWMFTLRHRALHMVVEVRCGDVHRDFFMQGNAVMDGDRVLSSFTWSGDRKIFLDDPRSLIEAATHQPAAVTE